MTRKQFLRPILFLALATIALMALVYRPATAEPAAEPSNAPDWSTPELLSLDLQGVRPYIAADPVGDKLLVVFIGRANNSNEVFDDNPYYLLSLDRGDTWTPFTSAIPQPIYISNNTQSLQVSAAFDHTGDAHAVWIENFSLFYAHQNDWPVGTSVLPTTISPVATAPGASEPAIVSPSGNILDVVWSEGDGGNPPDLYHSRSLNGGDNWSTPAIIANSAARENFPSVLVDPNDSNLLHVVWEAAQGNLSAIFYAQGVYNGTTMVWSTPVQVTPDDSEDRLPELTITGRGLAVAYAHVVPAGTIPGLTDDVQQIDYVTCSQNCTSSSGWRAPRDVSGPPFLNVNENYPFYVFSTMTNVYGCDYLYFHGFEVGSVRFESVKGVNGCAGWKASGAEEIITQPGISHALFPAVNSHPDGWVYLAYQQATIENGSVVGYPEIYFMRGEVPLPNLYLPAILKN